MWIRVPRDVEGFKKKNDKACKVFSTLAEMKNIDIELISKYMGVKLWVCQRIKYGGEKQRAKVI